LLLQIIAKTSFCTPFRKQTPGINPDPTKNKIKNVAEVFRPPLAEGIAETKYGKLKLSATLNPTLGQGSSTYLFFSRRGEVHPRPVGS